MQGCRREAGRSSNRGLVRWEMLVLEKGAEPKASPGFVYSLPDGI